MLPTIRCQGHIQSKEPFRVVQFGTDRYFLGLSCVKNGSPPRIGFFSLQKQPSENNAEIPIVSTFFNKLHKIFTESGSASIYVYEFAIIIGMQKRCNYCRFIEILAFLELALQAPNFLAIDAAEKGNTQTRAQSGVTRRFSTALPSLIPLTPTRPLKNGSGSTYSRVFSPLT